MSLLTIDRKAAQPTSDAGSRPATPGPAAVGFSDGYTVAHPSRSHPAILAYLHLRRLEACLIATIWGG